LGCPIVAFLLVLLLVGFGAALLDGFFLSGWLLILVVGPGFRFWLVAG